MAKMTEEELNRRCENACARSIAWQDARKAFKNEREKDAMRHGFNDGFKEALRLIRYYEGKKLTD